MYFYPEDNGLGKKENVIIYWVEYSSMLLFTRNKDFVHKNITNKIF